MNLIHREYSKTITTQGKKELLSGLWNKLLSHANKSSVNTWTWAGWIHVLELTLHEDLKPLMFSGLWLSFTWLSAFCVFWWGTPREGRPALNGKTVGTESGSCKGWKSTLFQDLILHGSLCHISELCALQDPLFFHLTVSQGTSPPSGRYPTSRSFRGCSYLWLGVVAVNSHTCDPECSCRQPPP